jgi:hypothetical protein
MLSPYGFLRMLYAFLKSALHPTIARSRRGSDGEMDYYEIETTLDIETTNRH